MKKEVRDSLSADYKILLETDNLKCRGIVNDVNMQLIKQKLVISGDGVTLRTDQIKVTSVCDKAIKAQSIYLNLPVFALYYSMLVFSV